MHLKGEAVTFHDFFKNYEKSARLIVYFSMLGWQEGYPACRKPFCTMYIIVLF